MDIRVLIVEDSDDHALVLKACLEAISEPHYIIERAVTLKAAIQRLTISKEAAAKLEEARDTPVLDPNEIIRLQKLIIGAVLLDLTLPDSKGNKLDVISQVAEASKHVGIVVHTGWGNRDFEQVVKEAGANALLHKGNATPQDVSRELQFAILQKQHEKEEHRLEATLRRIGKIVDKIGSIND